MILIIRKVIQQKVWAVNNSFRHMKQVFFQACVEMIRSGNLQLNLQHLETVADFGTQEVKLIRRRAAYTAFWTKAKAPPPGGKKYYKRNSQ